MKTLTTAAALTTALLVLTGCGATMDVPVAEKPAEKSAVTAEPAQPDNQTLHRYIVDNKIAEAPFKAGEPGTPEIDFPFPPDWSSAGDRTPDWAYGAIIYDKAANADDPPFMYAIASKLTGDVDPEKILEYAPAQLNELPEFKPLGEPERSTMGGFESVDYVGTYVWEGKPRAVGQQTIVIPGKDAVFVLQLNGEAPRGEEQPVIDAIQLINKETTITLPS